MLHSSHTASSIRIVTGFKTFTSLFSLYKGLSDQSPYPFQIAQQTTAPPPGQPVCVSVCECVFVSVSVCGRVDHIRREAWLDRSIAFSLCAPWHEIQAKTQQISYLWTKWLASAASNRTVKQRHICQSWSASYEFNQTPWRMNALIEINPVWIHSERMLW